jgi:CBS domain-containing protein
MLRTACMRAIAALPRCTPLSSPMIRGSLSFRRWMGNNRSNRGTIHSDVKRKPATHAPAITSDGEVDASQPYALASSLTIADVLSRYQADGRTFTCAASQSLSDAVALMVHSRVGCLVAMEEDGEHVAGLVTERDILSELVRLRENGSDWTRTPVSAAMTRSREMVHCRSSDLIDDALTLMTSQGFRHLPVLDVEPGGGAHLRGMVSMRNLVDVIYKQASAGGKAQFLNDILPRTGVPKHTTTLRKRRGDASTASSMEAEDAPLPSLFLNAGVCALPHPDKQFGEDSFVAIVTNVASTDNTSINGDTLANPISVLAVFDGVGMLAFEKGIQHAARFSNALAEGLKTYVNSHPLLTANAKSEQPQQPNPAILSPASMLSNIWQRVSTEKIPGSSTACILSLAHHSNELRAANIGDSGFLLLRKRDAKRGGSVGASAVGHSAWQVGK